MTPDWILQRERMLVACDYEGASTGRSPATVEGAMGGLNPRGASGDRDRIGGLYAKSRK
jgi:hypothetical protein